MLLRSLRLTEAVLVVIVLGSCGGGDDESRPAAAPTTATSSSALPVSSTTTLPGAVPRDVVYRADRPLRLVVNRSGGSTAETPDPRLASLANVTVEADVSLESGTGAVGVFCRGRDERGYDVTIDPARRAWSIVKRNGDDHDVRASGSGDGRLTTGVNHIEVECRTLSQPQSGNPAQITLRVRGEQLGRVVDTDSPLVEGAVGPVAISAGGAVTAVVDGFTVRQLPG